MRERDAPKRLSYPMLSVGIFPLPTREWYENCLYAASREGPGLLDVAKNPHQLAAVIGYEIAHVQAEHSNARMSTTYATQADLALVQVLTGGDSQEQQQLMGLLALGAQVGVLLPYSRAQESEADVLGLEYMARAGFDSRESIILWQNMAQAGGQQPPEFLSTHPAHGTRIEQLQSHMPQALHLYQQARDRGKTPNCG